MLRLLLASLLLLHAGCTLVTCDDICDVPGGGAGGDGGGAAGGDAGGAAGGDAGGAAGGDAGGAAGGEAGGAAGGDAGGAAGGDAGGAAGGDAGGSAGGAPRTSVVFVTNATFHGNLQLQAPGFIGAAAADRLCTVAATSASLPGTFKAWVAGNPGISPSSRLNDSSPWVVNGTSTVAFSSKTALSGFPQAPINRNERGFLVTGTNDVWTGATNGFTTGASCNTWSNNMAATMGIKGALNNPAQWTSTGTMAACNSTARLYCFEQQ